MTVTFRPITVDLLVGNVSSLILLLVSLGYYYLEEKKHFKSGIFIGIAASLKLAPLLIVSLHIMRNKYTAIVAVIATIALILLLPTTKYGVNSNFSQTRAYVYQAIIPHVTHPNVTTFHANQSASAVIYRYLSPSDAADPASSVPSIYVNIMSLSRRPLQIISAIARLSILSATFLTLMLYRKSYDLLPYQYSLILLAMTLISSLAWIHHYVVMLFPMLALLKDAIAGKWKLFFPLSVTMLLMSGTAKVVVGLRMSVVFSAYGLTFLAGMIIYGTTLYILWNNYMQGRRCGTGDSLSLKSG
jgi:hypothetical protein